MIKPKPEEITKHLERTKAESPLLAKIKESRGRIRGPLHEMLLNHPEAVKKANEALILAAVQEIGDKHPKGTPEERKKRLQTLFKQSLDATERAVATYLEKHGK